MLRKILLVVVCVFISGCCGRPPEESNKIEDIHIRKQNKFIQDMQLKPPPIHSKNLTKEHYRNSKALNPNNYYDSFIK